jgi:hypothetical protein
VNSSRQDPPPEAVRARLASLPGVQDADLSHFPESVAVTVDPGRTVDLAREAVRLVVSRETGADPEVRVDLSPRSALPSRRSRFDSLQTSVPEPGRLAARVLLEWQGELLEGEAEGEYNPGGELRVCASAALRAIERTISGAASFALIGVKELQVFDHNLVVVLIHSSEVDDGYLIGMSIIVQDRRHAAALAALNATNRVVGRFV